MVVAYVEGRIRRFLQKMGTYTTPAFKEKAEDFSGNFGTHTIPEFKENAEDFSGNLAPTRRLICRKKQKINRKKWYPYDSYVHGRRRFIREFGTYTIPEFKENTEDFSGNLAPIRFQNSRKTQKISPEIWHLHDSRLQGKRRRFLRKFGT
jgi:hypothetical protein